MGSPASISLPGGVPSPSRAGLYRLTIAILLVIAGLSVFDRFLANLESTELALGAERDYENGLRLFNAGKAAEAVDPLLSAHATERENELYELALIRALADSGRTADAEPLMQEVLERSPNDGNANLAAARLEAKKGDPEGAEAYYHRAIFGQWTGPDAAAHRTAARMELIDYLAAKGQQQPLLAELISLDAEAPPDPGVQAKVAQLFLAAGSPERSAAAWENYLNSHRRDAMAWAGLGEAELQAGDYPRARSAFRQALALDPGDAAIKARYNLVDLVADLDPTPPQLSAAQKYARGVRLLDMANADLARCSSSEPPVNPATLDAEQVLSAAQQTWQLRVKTCAGISKDEDALRLIMDKLAAQ